MNPFVAMTLARGLLLNLAEANKKRGMSVVLPSTRDISEALQTAVKDSPVLTNQMNLEPLPTSRTFVGSIGSFFASLAIVLTMVGAHTYHLDQYDWNIFGPALSAVFLALYAVLGRVRQGLAPIRWFGWFRRNT